MEQINLSRKPFKQMFHIIDIKHGIIGIPLNTKYISTINFFNGKLQIKDTYTKINSTILTFFER